MNGSTTKDFDINIPDWYLLL